jgi:hypothetical protein
MRQPLSALVPLLAIFQPPRSSNDEIDGFMNAIKYDPLVQNEAVATTSAQGVTPQTIGLSPRTQLSPEVVSAVRG